MKTHDVQSISLSVPAADAFAFVSQPGNLPKWAKAFERADEGTARLVTPAGAVDIKLETVADRTTGTTDWIMTFPDGAVGSAFSRVTPQGEDRSIFSFVLMAPPVPLEAIEGALEEQRKTLAEELKTLKKVIERA